MPEELGENPTAVQAAPPEPTGGQAGGQPPSPSLETVMNVLTDVTNRLARAEGRIAAQQSGKDRKVAAIESDLSSYRPVLDKVKSLLEKGVTDFSQIEREVEYDALKERVFGTEQPSPQAPASSGNGTGTPAPEDMAIQVAKSLELAVDDPEVVEILRSQQGVAAVTSLATLATQRATAPAPTPGSGAAIPGGGIPPKSGQPDISGIVDSGELYRMASKNLKVRGGQT